MPNPKKTRSWKNILRQPEQERSPSAGIPLEELKDLEDLEDIEQYQYLWAGSIRDLDAG